MWSLGHPRKNCAYSDGGLGPHSGGHCECGKHRHHDLVCASDACAQRGQGGAPDLVLSAAGDDCSPAVATANGAPMMRWKPVPLPEIETGPSGCGRGEGGDRLVEVRSHARWPAHERYGLRRRRARARARAMSAFVALPHGASASSAMETEGLGRRRTVKAPG